MVFAYPLKFLATFLVDFFTGNFADDMAIAAVLSLDQAPWLTAIYSLGYAAVFFVFGLLYLHAQKRADDIGLNKAEKILTRTAIKSNFTHSIFGVIVALLAVTLPGNWNLLAGAFYMFIAIPLAIIGNKGSKEADLAIEKEVHS